MRTLLIDGDPLAYVGACRSETKVDWDGEGEVSRYGNPSLAYAETLALIRKLKEELDADKVLICLSDPTRRYFRHDIYPAYKAHRTHGSAPVDLSAVKLLLRGGSEDFQTKAVATLEADDVLGILATHPTLVPGEKIVVGIDKDLMQIPGRHYNPNKDISTEISHQDAELFFMTQCLTGDPTDGFPGCPGIGPKKAQRYLNPSRSLWSGVVAAYLDKGLSERDAIIQAQVARICHHSDYNFQQKKVIPWSPPNM